MKTTKFHLRCGSCGWTYRGVHRLKVCRHRVPANPAAGSLSALVWCLGKMQRVDPPKRWKPTGLAKIDADIANAQVRLTDAITKVKLGTTLIDRWQKKLAYLNRKRAAAQAAVAPPSDDRVIALED
jgi:hypothetical protein